MYRNLGIKIQVFGKILGILLPIVGVIAWLILISNGEDTGYYGRGFVYTKEDDIWAWVALVAGIFGFFHSWLIIGFGKLVEDNSVDY